MCGRCRYPKDTVIQTHVSKQKKGDEGDNNAARLTLSDVHKQLQTHADTVAQIGVEISPEFDCSTQRCVLTPMPC